MARIHDLIRQAGGRVRPSLARDLEREVDALSERRAFGLNFERHTPEEVELPGRPVRRGDKVHVLPPRGETPKAANAVMWVVESIDRAGETATVGSSRPEGDGRDARTSPSTTSSSSPSSATRSTPASCPPARSSAAATSRSTR